MAQKPIQKVIRNDKEEMPQGLSLETKNHMYGKRETLADEKAEARKDAEQAQATQDQELRRTRKHQMDALTVALGCSGYFHHMSWTWFSLRIGGTAKRAFDYPLSVTRFYHEINLAIDIGPEDPARAQYKKDLLKANNIEYVHCKDSEAVDKMVRERRTN